MSRSGSWLVLFPFCQLFMLKANPARMPPLLGHLLWHPHQQSRLLLGSHDHARCLRASWTAVPTGFGFQIEGHGEFFHKPTSPWTARMVAYSVFPMPAVLAQRRGSFIQQIGTEHLQGAGHCSASGFPTQSKTGQSPALIDILVGTSRWTNQ